MYLLYPGQLDQRNFSATFVNKREGFDVSIQEKARALMMRYYQLIKNRQQSMLARTGEELGRSRETSHYWNPIQGKIDYNTRLAYDRSRTYAIVTGNRQQ